MTTIGRLIGVVGLKELRKAIEDVNHHHGQSQVANAEKIPVADIEYGNDDDDDDDNNNDDEENQYTLNSIDSMAASSNLSSEKEEIDQLMVNNK